jgi:hypothetical protein
MSSVKHVTESRSADSFREACGLDRLEVQTLKNFCGINPAEKMEKG